MKSLSEDIDSFYKRAAFEELDFSTRHFFQVDRLKTNINEKLLEFANCNSFVFYH